MLRRNFFQTLGATAESAGAKRPLLRLAVAFCVLALLGLVYLPALRGGLLWDDAAHVTSPELRSLQGLVRIWTELGATQQYYPVLHTAFWVEHRLWGDAVLGYHVVNLALHAVAAGLFWRVLRELKVSGAGFAALLFAFHPVCVESVAWISEQKNTLSLVFSLAAALAYVGFEQTRTARGYGVALGFFLLALATKSVTATLPAALLVTIWWRRGELRWTRDWRPLVPWLVIGAGAGLFTAWVERTVIGATGAAYDLTPLMRVLLAGRAACFYLGKLVWPADLAFVYPRWTIDPREPLQLIYPAVVVGLLAALAVRRPQRRGLLAGLLVFLGTLFPALGFLNVYPFVYSYVADHFQYHASLAVLALIGAGWARWRDQARDGRSPWWRVAPGVAAGLVLAVCALQANRQSRQYRDVETLYLATLELNPGCVLVHNNLGMICALRGDSASAIAHFRAALTANPNFAEAEDNLGGELAKLPVREGEAVAHFEAALRIRPDFPMAHLNLANGLAAIPGRGDEAEPHYRRVLELAPKYAKAHNDFAIWLAGRPGRRAEALTRYEEALRLDPGSAVARANYAYELSRDPARQREAITHYELALNNDPAQAEAQNNLANLLASTPGREAEAIAHYEAALRTRPDYAEAHNNLANQLIGLAGRAAEAVVHYEQAVRIRPDYAEAHNNLAIAYANDGRLADAERHFRLAIQHRPDFAAARENLRRLLAPSP